MGRPVIVALAAARRAGMLLDRRGERLTGRYPRASVGLFRELGARKPEVFELLPLYRGEVAGLDWRHASLGDPAPCLLCGRPALCREPYDGNPCHKVCVEATLSPTGAGSELGEARAA